MTMSRAEQRVGSPGGAVGGWVAALALCLLAACHQAAAQASAGECAPPPPWQVPGAKPGQPQVEFAACLKDQAYETRELTVPVDANAYGIIAQCHVRVDRFEGVVPSEAGSDEERQAADREDVRQATAAILQYRRCAGR